MGCRFTSRGRSPASTPSGSACPRVSSTYCIPHVPVEMLTCAALMPQQGPDGQEGPARPDSKEYQGISFGNWLDLFIDYAISLAAEGQYDEAYRVCEAAKDSTVFTVDEDNTFFIYIAWGGKPKPTNEPPSFPPFPITLLRA